MEEEKKVRIFVDKDGKKKIEYYTSILKTAKNTHKLLEYINSIEEGEYDADLFEETPVMASIINEGERIIPFNEEDIPYTLSAKGFEYFKIKPKSFSFSTPK